MGTGFLTPAQIARIKAVRVRAWNRAFQVITVTQGPITDYYDDPDVASATRVLSGDWAWRGQSEHRGEGGGIVEHAEVQLACDVIYSGALMAPGVRLRVDGILVAPVRITPYPDSGEIVVQAVRVLTSPA